MRREDKCNLLLIQPSAPSSLPTWNVASESSSGKLPPLVIVHPSEVIVVAVYIKESWWPTEDVLRTSDPAREGLMKNKSGHFFRVSIPPCLDEGNPRFSENVAYVMDRKKLGCHLHLMNRVMSNATDTSCWVVSSGRPPPGPLLDFSRNISNEGGMSGECGVGSGSLCGDGTGVCYLLPVFDTVFVRRTYRRQGLGMAMLQDFCETFREDEALGVSWPISPAMYQVCRKFLLAHPEERGRLWEVEPPGAWGQRGSIWLKVQLQQSRPPDSHPGNAKEDVSSQGRTSPDDGPRQSEEGKKDCGVKEAAAGRLGRACGARPEGKEAKRTAVDAGLAWGSQQKHLGPSS
ncbi:hypothetical protein GH733_014864 [Mirounga leonina]|nr:hypothetical protein GH733_014864 [Mirounga leonina]